ncbi:pre-peptidase C-terminal domain-containing protein [Undibacterium sp. LX40W]|uniref:Pre-peptidase C-terminal domain-containing protein n=1 Tax=Undibacterium nitidum TaxID=2762298 RepID=A0A923HPM5_9BURK|nr:MULTISPECIES: alkaline phosphatase family protein [Undibacterium]MBC3881588.1 pre-peptidase C-terminal domain-containing protein [Undibacterium nitidum]MBC3891630.1 pre-peptidase C-terminal domain-containing protein [Undibacterium sp. LX40W]
MLTKLHRLQAHLLANQTLGLRDLPTMCRHLVKTVLSATAIVATTWVTAQAQTIPRYDHVVIVIMENQSADQVIGNANAPYINSLAKAGAYFSNSHGITHPSQPNYIGLFSGSTQGVTDDSCPKSFSKANLASQLIGAGFTFAGYSEDMPSVGYTGCSVAKYARKHNPWVNFSNVPAASNQPFTAFPSDFTKLPTVSFVIPNLCNDNHDCPTNTGDTWLKTKLDAYVQWAKTHNSLLILTWDEDDFQVANHISTIFVGAKISPAVYSTNINHYSVLRTLEDMYGLSPIGNAASASAIVDPWGTVSPPSATPLTNGVPVTGVALTKGSSNLYQITVPAGRSSLTIKTTGGTGDADIYAQLGTAPSTTSYLKKSDGSTSVETISITSPAAGTYYVLVNAYASFSGVTLTASF